jgi:2,3-bisphosphoglycerate-independent phosphoglycerate mutase
VDDVEKYDEISLAKGSMGRIRGKDLVPILLDSANKNELYGA